MPNFKKKYGTVLNSRQVVTQFKKQAQQEHETINLIVGTATLLILLWTKRVRARRTKVGTVQRIRETVVAEVQVSDFGQLWDALPRELRQPAIRQAQH